MLIINRVNNDVWYMTLKLNQNEVFLYHVKLEHFAEFHFEMLLSIIIILNQSTHKNRNSV